MSKVSYRNQTIKEMAKVDRPREKLSKLGPEGLSNSELLAAILGKGLEGKNAIGLANDLLKKFSAKNLPKLSYKELLEEKGIGPAGASRILATFELANRILLKQEDDAPVINEPQDAFNLLEEMGKYKKEHFVGLYLNARNQLIHQETISIGTLTTNLIHPREVFEPAVTRKAVAVILSHNHPSGNLEPSKDDINQTKQIREAGEIMGISLLDHIIITENKFASLKELNHM